MKKQNVWVLGLDERGSPDYMDFDFRADCVLVLGREGAGLHDLVKKTCDHLLRIPMAGAVSSLNVSVAGAIVMYEAVRQRRQSFERELDPSENQSAKGAGLLKYALCLLLVPALLHAQEKEPAAPPPGTVIFQKGEEAPAAHPDSARTDPAAEASEAPSTLQAPVTPDASVSVSDAEREAVTFTAYDLDLHLTPALAGLEAHVNFTVRNDGTSPLERIALQVSSSLVWESLVARSAPGSAKFVQHRITTDADHTGVAPRGRSYAAATTEPRSSLDLSAFYAGSIQPSAERLERIGAPRPTPQRPTGTQFRATTSRFAAMAMCSGIPCRRRLSF